jgi:hypothetical protein
VARSTTAAATRKSRAVGKIWCAVHDWANGRADCRLTPDPPQFISILTAKTVQHLFGHHLAAVAGRDANEQTPGCHFRWLCEGSMLPAGDLWAVNFAWLILR